MSKHKTTDAQAEAFIARFADEARRVAQREYKNSSVYETDDIVQEIWLAVLKNRDFYVAKVEEMEERGCEAATISKDMEGLFAREARKYCKRETLDYQFFSGAVLYSGNDVKNILKDTMWADHVGEDGNLERVVEREDVNRAMRALTAHQRKVLRDRYDKLIPLNDNTKRVHSVAIERLTSKLNGDKNYNLLDIDDLKEAL